jgi:acetyl/propionyl-CoA carboxylase alpha subunit
MTAAAEIGYPVFLKAVAGGGGKGMSIVADAEELERVHRQASDEAVKSFGDGAMYLEKVVERPRHIEIQIFADTHGNTVALGERECSIQRRHQKIIEEAPSPAVSPELRARMSAAAVAAAEAVGYVGAGTIEFLLDPSGEFYFLEMNTRLQVEHPVTEWITGLDLVRLQLEVAGGAALPPEALEPTFVGHAIECRVYAEDPAAGHLPQAGRLLLVREPSGPGVRVDAALAEGQEIGVHFDPMLAKVSCWARDRDVAIARMREALRRYVLLGVQTNLDHLQDILAVAAFAEGDLTTAFLDEHLADWPPSEDLAPLAMAATLLADRYGAGRTGHTDAGTADPLAGDPWRTLGRFRMGAGESA